MKRRRTLLSWRTLALASLCLLVTVALGWYTLPFAAPLPPRLLHPQPVSPTYLAVDGTPLRQMLATDGQRVATPVTADDLPPALVHALLAAEDKRFYSHGGVDLVATARAAWGNITSRRIISGASTLTQQLVKVSAETTQPRSIRVKIIEALQARRLEMTWSKPEILTAYLNRVSFGNLLTGCKSAAQGYLNKPLHDLTPAECALLASLPQSPSRLNPYRNLPAVQKRQCRVLEKMHLMGWLDDEGLKLALAEQPTLQKYTGGFAAPHAVELARLTSEKSGSAVVRTTIQQQLQSRVEGIIARRLALLENKHVTQAAAVVIENSTGHVLALAGSRAFFGSDGGQINGAWAPHSPGSALKPFTYLLAFEKGFTPASIVADIPVEYATPTGLYRPENYDHRYQGPITIRQALGSSLNIPAVRVLDQIGGETVLHSALQWLGISTLEEPSSHYGLGLTIGNAPVRLLELANAYACLARLGEARPWTLTADADLPDPVRLYPAATSYLIADILSDNQARVLTFGPHSVIRLPFRCAVKTGTSTNYRDNWTLGYTPEYTVAVWVGNFDNTPMNEVSGVTGAGPIFRDIFVNLHQTSGTTWYEMPDEVVAQRIDPRNGRSLDGASPAVRMSRDEVFIKGSLPSAATADDYEPETGRAYIPKEYETWLKQGQSAFSALVALRDDASNIAAPRILTPVDGTVFFLDPDLRNQGGRLMLKSSRSDAVQWSSPTLKIVPDGGQHFVLLAPGRHEITATNPVTKDAHRVRIEVREPPTAADKLRQVVR